MKARNYNATVATEILDMLETNMTMCRISLNEFDFDELVHEAKKRGFRVRHTSNDPQNVMINGVLIMQEVR